MNILDRIHGHADLVNLSEQERICLCQQIRNFLVANVSKTGGHLSSNLGAVELTVAIETVFDTEVDRLVFDVGHQSYVHKILTGRKEEFSTLRQFGGIAGFPKPSESNADAFVAGHSSSSISIALGMARARTLQGEKYNVLALLGDGAATGGMVYEGLNDASVSNEPLVVILNDNELSIDKNVGGMASHLSRLRTKEKYLGMKRRYHDVMTKIPGGKFLYRVTRAIKDSIRRMLIPETIFESMGLTYLGPVDGHNTEDLIKQLQIAKKLKRPVLLHVITKKGKGYAPAEEHPKLFHGVGKFDPDTGEVPQKNTQTFSDAFGNMMCQLAEENEKVCAITAAMPGGTGLLEFKKQFSKRMFDVGIAEQHAVSMAGGLAKQGMVPVVALYSTFLQRSYDMILHDICMLNLHVVLAIDRAGLVGEDGETHHGIFDLGFLRHAPNMTILCPGSILEFEQMMRWAVCEHNGPIAIRYPRGGDRDYIEAAWNPELPIVKHRIGQDCTIVTYGSMINNVLSASDILADRGINASVVRLTQIEPISDELLQNALKDCSHCIIVEESGKDCGIYSKIAWKLHTDCKFYHIDLGDQFPTHGNVNKLYENYNLDAKSIADYVQEVLKVEN